MNFKFILCFVFTIFAVSVSNAVDVKCNVDDGLHNIHTCVIGETIRMEPGDSLNIINVANANEIKQIYVFADVANVSKIVTFPSELFEKYRSVENVKIINVKMKRLVRESFRNAQKLRKFNLAFNKLTTIPANLISLAPNLDDLYLAKNRISEIENFAFNSSSLRILYLSRNRLKLIRKYIFFYAPQCEVIHLDENFIENIEDGTFDLPKLMSLNLDRNHLKTLPPNLFTNVPKLDLLSLAVNQLSTDIVLTLEKAKGLTELYLDDNPGLRGVNLLSLRQLPKLETLNLRNTSLTDSTIAYLPDLPALTKLFMNNNSLNFTNLLHYLGRLKRLETLDIEGNNFTKLDDFSNLTSYLPRLRVIYISDNQWDCAWISSAKKTCELRSIECFGLPTNCK